METCPDAPWIRDAEQNGIDDADPVKCPWCGEECDYIYEDGDGYFYGCNKCVKKHDAYDWFEMMKGRE